MADPFLEPLPALGQAPWTLNPNIEELQDRISDLDYFVSSEGLQQAIADAAAALNPDELSDSYIAGKISTSGTETRTALNTVVTAATDPLVPRSQKGAPYGVAELAASGRVPIAQLPVDQIATSSDIATAVRNNSLPTFSVLRYGAQPNNSSFDNLPAFNATFAACVAAGGGVIDIPAGSYRLSDEWNVYRPNSPRVDIIIKGESQYTTKLFSNFYGADKALIKSRDPLGVTRSSPTSIVDIQLGTVARTGGVNPCLIDLYGLGESRLESVRMGVSNNTHLRVSSAQNVRMRDIVSFSASQHFNYRDTTGITFSSTSNGQVLTSSADIFTANDTNRLFNIYGPSVRASYRITSYVNARTVNISSTTPTFSITNGSGFFEPARATINAGSNQMTANAQVFSANDVGRTIYIQGAKAGAYGPALLRARITSFVSSATVLLDVSADNSVARAEFAVPAVDVWTPSVSGTAGAGSNDVKIDLLHIENYSGVGMVVQNSIFMHITDAKIHGEQSPSALVGSTSHMWLDDYGGTIGIDLDGTSTGAERIYVCNANDLLTFNYLATRNNFNDIVVLADTFTDPGGQVQITTFNSYTEAKSGNPYDLILDVNANPKVIFVGLVSMLGDSLLSRIYMGKNMYISVLGNPVLQTSDGSWRRLVIQNDGTVTSSAV
jgi:hypothetical protein